MVLTLNPETKNIVSFINLDFRNFHGFVGDLEKVLKQKRSKQEFIEEMVRLIFY